ncbi:MAG: ArsR/SmtB family transcription factor [Gemmatimonadales bacterium]
MATSARRFKSAVYDQLARVAKSMASAVRLELLDLLSQAPRTVESLALETGQSIANTSQHLQVLRRACIVEAEKQGQYVRYRLADAQVADLCRSLRVLATARVTDVQRIVRDYLAKEGNLEPVEQKALIGRVARGEVTLIDVRPAEEYRAGHIKGAISMPLDELDEHLPSIPRRRDVVAYCRGPYCVLAIEAATRLRARGFRAFRLEAGVVDWRAQGLRVAESGSAGAPKPRAVRGDG